MIFYVMANKNARYKPNELEFMFYHEWEYFVLFLFWVSSYSNSLSLFK